MTTAGERELREIMEGLPGALARFEAEVEEWSVRRFTGAADDGRVRATVDAFGSLLQVEIHVLSRRRLDNVSLGRAVVAAVHDAEAAAARAKDDLMRGFRLPGAPPVAALMESARRDFQERTGFIF